MCVFVNFCEECVSSSVYMFAYMWIGVCVCLCMCVCCAYVFMYVCVFVHTCMYLPIPLHGHDVTQGQFLRGSLKCLNSKSSFS